MRSKIFMGIVILAIGFFAGIVIENLRLTAIQKAKANINSDSCDYPLINPVFCNEGAVKKTKINIGVLQTKLTTYISEVKNENRIKRASVYFRDLQNGPIINIDAYEDYYGGSLLKVPVMLYYLKQAETDSSILDKVVTIDESIPPSQLENPAQSAKVGNSYTVRELLEKMIIHSDNSAKNALIKTAPELLGKEKSLDHVYSDLGFDDEANKTGELSLQEYATIFTIIYNSQYLSQKMSHDALTILSKTSYDRGIAAGVPTKITVANKFGIPSINSDLPQLHDCGIIYHQASPYILCIFTEGDDLLEIEDVISHISQIIYEEINTR